MNSCSRGCIRYGSRLLLVLAVALLAAASAHSATQSARVTETRLAQKLTEAERLYKLFRYDQAIRVTREIIADSGFDSLATDVKIRAGLLLVESYWAQEKKADAEDAIRKLLSWRRDFPFDSLKISPELKQICESMQEQLPPLSPGSFEFAAVQQPVEVRVGKEAQVRIATRQSDVPVRLRLESPAENLTFTQMDSISAILSYTPLPSDADSVRKVKIFGWTKDTTKTMEIAFAVKCGRSTWWWTKRIGGSIVGGGLVCAVIILIGGGGGGGDDSKLPYPPPPPGKSGEFKSIERGVTK